MRFVLAFFLLVFPFDVFTQDTREIDFSILADDLLPYQDGEGNLEELYENLLQLMSQPVDVNSATHEELRVIPFLTDKQIQHLLYHRAVHGKLISVYELQSIPEFDIATIQKMLPFIRVTDPSGQLNRSFLNRIAEDGNTYLIVRHTETLEQKKGFFTEDIDQKFQGSNGNQYVRFRSSKPGEFSFGFTADQDAGEKYEWKPGNVRFGFDHLSVHAQIVNKGKISNLILGDYQCQFGQGLILGGGFGMGKGAETINTVRKNSFGFVPYTSVNESGFLRGGAVTVRMSKQFYLSAFYSKADRDASITSNDSTSSVSSFLYNGLHRNVKELEKRKQVSEQNLGGVLEYRRSRFNAGVIANRILFSEDLNKKLNAYNQFAFRGNVNTNVSIYANYTRYNHNVFAEVAQSWHSGRAIIAGIISSLHPKIDMSLLYRKFDKDYHTFYSNAFSESSSVQNETGIYWGWKYQWKKKVMASGYMDLFKFPWLGFRRYTSNGSGHEWLVRISYQPSRKAGMFFQTREELKEKNSSEPSVVYNTSPSLKRNYVLNFDYAATAAIRLQTRAQFSTYSFKQRRSMGSVVLQDIHLIINRVKLTARYALFDTEDFDNRQYVYENDVWLAYSMPAYEGVGVRSFVVLQYKFSKSLSVWVRYARTKYTDRDEIGSGLEMIRGNVRNDIKLQARLSL